MLIVVVRDTHRPRLAAVSRSLTRHEVGSTTVVRGGRAVRYPRFAWEGVVAASDSWAEARAIADVWSARGASARVEIVEAA